MTMRNGMWVDPAELAAEEEQAKGLAVTTGAPGYVAPPDVTQFEGIISPDGTVGTQPPPTEPKIAQGPLQPGEQREDIPTGPTGIPEVMTGTGADTDQTDLYGGKTLMKGLGALTGLFAQGAPGFVQATIPDTTPDPAEERLNTAMQDYLQRTQAANITPRFQTVEEAKDYYGPRFTADDLTQKISNMQPGGEQLQTQADTTGFPSFLTDTDQQIIGTDPTTGLPFEQAGMDAVRSTPQQGANDWSDAEFQRQWQQVAMGFTSVDQLGPLLKFDTVIGDFGEEQVLTERSKMLLSQAQLRADQIAGEEIENFNKAIQQAQLTGDFNFSGMNAATIEKKQLELQEAIAQAELTGTYGENNIVTIKQRQLAIDEALNEASLTGQFHRINPVTGERETTAIGTLALEKFKFEKDQMLAERLLRESDLTGNLYRTYTDAAGNLQTYPMPDITMAGQKFAAEMEWDQAQFAQWKADVAGKMRPEDMKMLEIMGTSNEAGAFFMTDEAGNRVLDEKGDPINISLAARQLAYDIEQQNLEKTEITNRFNELKRANIQQEEMALAELYGVQYQIDEDTGEMSKAQIWDPNANDRRGGYVDIKTLATQKWEAQQAVALAAENRRIKEWEAEMGLANLQMAEQTRAAEQGEFLDELDIIQRTQVAQAELFERNRAAMIEEGFTEDQINEAIRSAQINEEIRRSEVTGVYYSPEDYEVDEQGIRRLKSGAEGISTEQARAQKAAEDLEKNRMMMEATGFLVGDDGEFVLDEEGKPMLIESARAQRFQETLAQEGQDAEIRRINELIRASREGTGLERDRLQEEIRASGVAETMQQSELNELVRRSKAGEQQAVNELNERIRAARAGEDIADFRARTERGQAQDERRRIDEIISASQAGTQLGRDRLNEEIRASGVAETLARDELDELIRRTQAGEQQASDELNERIRAAQAGETLEAFRAQTERGLGARQLTEAERAAGVAERLSRDELNFAILQASTGNVLQRDRLEEEIRASGIAETMRRDEFDELKRRALAGEEQAANELAERIRATGEQEAIATGQLEEQIRAAMAGEDIATRQLDETIRASGVAETMEVNQFEELKRRALAGETQAANELAERIRAAQAGETIAREQLTQEEVLAERELTFRREQMEAENERAQLQAQVSMLQSILQNPYAFGALQAIQQGQLPGVGGMAVPAATQQQQGVAGPIAALFGGGVPTTGGLQQMDPAALGILTDILGFRGISPQQLGQTAAGYTPGGVQFAPGQIFTGGLARGRRA